jgi:hypothetical protein
MAAVLTATFVHPTGTTWKQVHSPNPGSAFNKLYGVAVVSSRRAWAVGDYSNSNSGTRARALILRWNGTAWKRVRSPNPGSALDNLTGVAATSASNAWAVGYDNNGVGTASRTLIEHWNGTAWKTVPSPSPGGSGTFHSSVLNGVAAISATKAWAVGSYIDRTTHRLRTLIVRWNGTAWKQVPSPNVAFADNELNAVAATSARSAWAVGDSGTYPANQTLIERWNGTAWKKVRSPNPSGSGDSNILMGVAATSGTNAWAVGSDCTMCGSEAQFTDTLIVQWNGSKWQQVSSPSPNGFSNTLLGVAATSASNAWAVGEGSSSAALILHWTGSEWDQVPSPALTLGILNAAAATSARNIWAVGSYSHGTVALHCC